MFSLLLARTTSRQAFSHSLRCISSQPPPHTQPSTPSPPPSTSPSHPPSSLSLDFSPAEPKSETQRTGAKSSKNSLSSIERRRKFLGRIALGVFVVYLGGQAIYMGREWSEAELKAKKITIEEAPSTRWARTRTRFTDFFDIFSKPQWTELLPPPLPAPHQKPYTLLLSLDDLIVTSTWDRQHGWRTAKRPGVDYFIAYLSQFYEVVIFTSQYHYTAMPIIEKLDPYNLFLSYKLYRDATRSVNGKIVKDLSYLNRDLSKVVTLDAHADHVFTHPENALVVPKWDGDPRDRGLIALIPFLESIGIYKPADVRPILQAYAGKDVPVEYAKKEAEAKAKHIEEWHKSGKGLATGGFTLSKLFGSSSPDSSPVPLTYLEQKRKEAQFQYKEEQAYLQSHKADFERLLEEDRQAMAKEMSGSLLGALDALSGGRPAKKDEKSGGGEGAAGDVSGGSSPVVSGQTTVAPLVKT